MGNFALGLDPLQTGRVFGKEQASFYVTQRKVPFAPCLGHDRLVDFLNNSRADEPRTRFLTEDKAGLKLIAENMRLSRFPGKVWTVPEGTIIFAQEPFAQVAGPFAVTQMIEVAFENAFDSPMTVSYLAMMMKEAAGEGAFVSDFSLRRGGFDLSKYLYIGGCDNTSNMEASFLYGLASVGTMAHYLVQAFMAFVSFVVSRNFPIPNHWHDEQGNLKHGERLCFEYWLDAHPQGTVCLVDTISLKLGLIHVIEAALSSPSRRKALIAVRIDSGDLAKGSLFARRMFDANGLYNVKIVPTGDLNDKKVREIKKELDGYNTTAKSTGIIGYAGGTKLVAEIDRIAGVVFKLVEFLGTPTLKCSGTPGKETLPGRLQLWRCEDKKGKYILDVISTEKEDPPGGEKVQLATGLLQPFWEQGKSPELKTPQELKKLVEDQKGRFAISLERYAKERVVLSDKLLRLKENIQKEYKEISPTTVRVVDWPE
ncbi:MAG: hypothetical protein HYW70_02400 [Candidatus Nealsonbacteria bacterium]|nr:hypothetical protein [Candidatus Nealsonbacteria bacterium]